MATIADAGAAPGNISKDDRLKSVLDVKDRAYVGWYALMPAQGHTLIQNRWFEPFQPEDAILGKLYSWAANALTFATVVQRGECRHWSDHKFISNQGLESYSLWRRRMAMSTSDVYPVIH